MANIDTLKYYEELLQGGVDKQQAKAHVYATVEATGDMVTNKDLDLALKQLEQHLKIYFAYIVGGFALLNIVAPIIFKYLS